MQELVDPQKMASKKPPDPIPRPRGGAAGASLSSTLLTDRPGSLQLKMDEMKEHITKLKKELETERMSSKRLKRDKMMELRNIRCEEQKKSAEALATLRVKLETEKVKELETLRESLLKQMFSERSKLLKEKDASMKSKSGQQREMDAVLQKSKNQYLIEAKEEAKKLHEAERTRFLNETSEFRSIKKKLEAELEHAVAANRKNGSELRRISEEHSRELDQLKKEARRDIIHLVEELKSKQRVIAELEKELGQQAGYALKLQAEKDTLGQELKLAKMADTWEKRSPSVSRSIALSPDSNKNETKDNSAPESSTLPSHFSSDIHFDTAFEQLSYMHIPELKQKLDQLACKEENVLASQEHMTFIFSISKVLQSAQETILNFEETNVNMRQRLLEMEEQYEKLKREKEEDNKKLQQRDDYMKKSLAEMEAEVSSYKEMEDTKASEIDKLRFENNQMKKEISASKETEESFKERILELEKLLEEQRFHIENLCKEHSQMESELQQGHQGHSRQLEYTQRMGEGGLNRGEELLPISHESEHRRSSFMETETEKTDSELQAESLWEAIEANKSSETDTQLNFLQDQSDQETSAVEELFQVLEKGTEKAPSTAGAAMDDLQRKEDEEEDANTVADDVDTDSSFSLPLPDDEVEDDSSDDEPPKRKLLVPEMFQDANSGFCTESRLDSEDDDNKPVKHLTEADMAAREFKGSGMKGAPAEKASGVLDKSPQIPGIHTTMDFSDNSSDTEEESDKEWDESEVLNKLGVEDKTSSTKVVTDGTQSTEYDRDDHEEDSQAEFSDLVSQNEELKSLVEEKDLAIQEMKATARTLKQVIRDQMTETEKLRVAEDTLGLETKLEELKMKEDTLKRVVKDLQISEQSLKEQLNQLIEERDDLKSQLKSFGDTINQGNKTETCQDDLDEKYKRAEQRVKEIEELNISMMEKYETEIAEKDLKYQTLERKHDELSNIMQLKDNLQQKLSETEHILREKDKEIVSLKDNLAEYEQNEESERLGKEQMVSKFQEMEESQDKVQGELARKCSEIIQLQAQLKLEREEKQVQGDVIAEREKHLQEIKAQLEQAENKLTAKKEECENIKERLEHQELRAQHDFNDVIAEKDQEIEKLKMQLTEEEDNLKAKLYESENKLVEAEESKRKYEEELSGLRLQLADFQDSQDEVSNLVEKAERDIALKIAEVSTLKASLHIMEEKYETEKSEKEMIRTTHFKLEGELMATRENVLQLEEQRSSLKKLLTEMKSEVEILNEENKLLDEKLSLNESKSASNPIVCEDVIIAHAEDTTEAVPVEQLTEIQEEKLQCQLKEKEEEVNKLESLVRTLEDEKVAMEERMKGIEELLKDSVIDNEDMLRERIVELECIEKTMKRRVQELELTLKESEEKVNDTFEEMKNLEESYEERFKELRVSEQLQMERVAELEEAGNHLKSETEMLKEQLDNSESMNRSMKEKLKEMETELEELQVVSKLAGDELGGTHKSLPSLMDEGLGALDTGRTNFSHYEEDFEDDDVEEDFVLSDDLPQGSASEALNDHSDEKVKLQRRVEELEKSEAMLMEKVEILEQSESELAELLESLQQNEAIVREASEQLENTRVQNQEMEESLDKALKTNQDLQEKLAELEIERDELLLKLEEETEKDEKLSQLQKDLEKAQNVQTDLENKYHKLEEENSSSLSKYKELEEAYVQMATLKDDLEKKLRTLSEFDTSNSSFITPESVSKLEEENKQIAKQLLEAEEERTGFVEKMKALQADIEFLEELKAGGEQSIAELSFQVESLESEVASKSRMLEENETVLEERQTELTELRRRLEEEMDLNLELEAQNKHLKEEYVVKNKMFQDNANIMEKKVIELDMTKKELATVTATCNELRVTICDLEKMMDDLKSERVPEVPEENVKTPFVVEEIISSEVQCMETMAPPPPLPTSLPPLTQYSAQMHNDEDDEDDDIDSPEEGGRMESAPTIEALQLRIQHLMDNEERLQEKIDELEQRQSAFNETLAAADSIMAEREDEFKEEISELQSSNNDLKQMLEEAKKQGQMSRRSSDVLTKSEEECSIFDCIDEDSETEYGFDDDFEEDFEETGKPKHQAGNAKRRRSVQSNKMPPKLKRIDSDDTLMQSQGKIADLMVKVDELEKQNADLLSALQEMEKRLSETQSDQELQAKSSPTHQEKNEMESEIQSLRAQLDAFKPFEDQFKLFLEEKDLSEADRHAQEHVSISSTDNEVKTLRERIMELESLQEELKEELKDTKLSEETLTEISEEQVNEIQRLKDDLDEMRSKISKEKIGKGQKVNVNKSELDELKQLQEKLSSSIAENKEYEASVQLMNDKIKQMEKAKEELQDEVDNLNVHVEKLEKSETKVTEDLQASEKSQEKLRQSNEQLERTVKALEDSIEMLTSRVQESDQGQERAKASNKVLESKFKDMLMSESTLKNNLKQVETTNRDLEQKVNKLERSDEKWKQEMQEMEDAILDTKRQSRRLEEEVKLLKLDNSQLKHENEILLEKVEDKKSQDLQTQNRLSEMEIGESNLRLQLKNSEIREAKLKEQLKDLEDSISTLKQKVSKTNKLEGDYDSLQRELQAAQQRANDYERSNGKLEEKLQQLEQNLRSNGMVSLSVSEYQELKAQATLASLADGDTPGAKEIGGGGGAAGEVWMRLDQKNKELREVQELYNQSVKENMKLKQRIRDLQTKGGPSSHIHPQESGGEDIEAKSTQTTPLKLLTKGALQTKILADDDELTLEDFLNALPHQSSDHASPIPIRVYGPLIQTEEDLIQVDQSASTFMHRQPIREQPIGEEVETGHVTMATKPVLDDGFDFDGFGLEVDEIDKLRVGSSVSDDNDVSLSSDAPPLPETSPPGQLKAFHRRTNSTSSDISDLAPPPPPLPSLPPPPKHMGGVKEGSGEISHLRAPSLDSGMETQEPEIEMSNSQDVHTGPPQLRLPTVPGSVGPPLAPKPGTPMWLKKMVDWQNSEKEKEHGEFGKMKEKVGHLSRVNQALEDELRQLKVEREQMRRQVQGANDAREFQQKLQSRELELEDKERQVMRLKTEIKEREMEVVRLKSQLEALSQAGKTSQSDEMAMWHLKDKLERTQDQLREKERLIHSHDASLGRVKADLVKKETELLAKENALQLKIDELTMVKERMRLVEEGQRDDTTRLQLSEYSSKLTTLTAENESLRTRLSELEPLEMQVGELRSELGRSSHSTRSTEAMERKLQVAQKMLHEKTENEMRLAEDNASLQQRLRTIQTQDTYTKDLEKEYSKLEDQMATLEHERNEAELAVAPLKAKVSYLTKKCQERDNLIRRLKQEIAVVKSDKSSELLEQIGNLSTLLPDEAYNEPLKTRSRLSKHKTSRKSNRDKLPDLSELLNDDEKEFLKRESLENGEALFDGEDDQGEISLQELLKQTNGYRHGIKGSLDDVDLDELDLLGTAGETGSDHFSVENGIGLGSRDRKGRSPVSFGFSSIPSSFKSRAVKDRQTRPSSLGVPVPGSNQTSPGSLGLDIPDGLISASLATQPSLPTSPPTQPHYQYNVPAPQPPHAPPSLPQGYPHQTPSILQNHPQGVPGTTGPVQQPSAPVQGLRPYPSDPPSAQYSGISAPNQYPQAPQPLPQMLNNSVPRPHPSMLPNGHPITNGMPSSMYGVGQTPSVGASLPLSHQNVLNLPGNQPNTNGLYHGPVYSVTDQGLNTGIPDPPKSLSISREVSKHSVLLTWSLPSMDVMCRSNGVEVVGYRIYVNGQQKQLVSSAHMTKALVDGIYLKTIYRFGICSVGGNGQTSNMAELSYNPTSRIPSSTASESGRSESIISSEVSSGPKYRQKEERLFMAIYTYDPESHSPNDNPEYELTFTEGDLITVYGDKRPDGFYHGKVQGRKGLVPSNFIEEISKGEARKKGSQELYTRKSRESITDGRRRREKKGRIDKESRRREGQTHRGSRM
ncbi:A-kinase anchor protein 9-like isoform X2 [Lytechinus variegatus]|uniref:A-kinase anchor protein 9-like isoform X2 n=1 Tax=Lytechinus variegatus TaxID=7654 RepID=UPI001BB1A1A9|nr:A-kinase anchor protein 9-like isoform X2 [Lytechinus variegatus]